MRMAHHGSQNVLPGPFKFTLLSTGVSWRPLCRGVLVRSGHHSPHTLTIAQLKITQRQDLVITTTAGTPMDGKICGVRSLLPMLSPVLCMQFRACNAIASARLFF